MGFFSKSLLLAAQQPTTAPSTSTATSTDTAAADSAAPAPAPAASTFGDTAKRRRAEADAARFAPGPEGESFGGMPRDMSPMPDVQQNQWFDPESGGMSASAPTYAPGVYDPNQSLAVNIGNAGLAGNAMGMGDMHPTFRSAIETAYGWNRMQTGGNAGDYGGQEAFSLIMSADPQRAAVDPLGYANELLVANGVIPRGFNSPEELRAVNMSLPGHNSTDWEWLEVAVPMALTAISGGALGPALGGGMLGTAAGTGIGSAGMAAMQGAPLDAALRAGAMSALGAGIAPTFAPSLGGGMIGRMAAGGLGSAGLGVLSGQDVDEAIRQGLMSAGTAGAIQYGSEFAAPYLSDAVDSFSAGFGGTGPEAAYDFDLSGIEGFDVGYGAPVMPAAMPMPEAFREFDPTFGGQLREVAPGQFERFAPMQFADSGQIMTDAAYDALDLQDTEATSPEFRSGVDPVSAEAYQALDVQDFEATSPEFSAGTAAPVVQTGEEQLAEEDEANRAALEEGDALTNEPQQTVTPEQIQKAIKVAQKLAAMLDKPESAPQRGEEQSDEEYAGDLADYLESASLDYGYDLGLDPQTMADLGLEPGSQAQLDYILNQADILISRILGDVDVDDAEALSAALGKLTESELQALQRAVHVRGEIAAMSGSWQIDPATGERVQVISPDGDKISGVDRAAYQTALAEQLRNVNSREELEALFARHSDMFGAQAKADARAELARRSERAEEEERRRRARFGR
jgi:hypothetical protein